ncbi:Hpt domain-containing protein [Deinococcus fonticola]|uniref:hybrid sensor histidine kinase/response regulator n=1 Tax=Deinococcus fonticola TaxID=2528713 RepID=UPI001075329A|nr:Hpt domain-containing protein [Deinococcus fonticola]
MQNSELLESFIQEAGEVMTGLEAGVAGLHAAPGQQFAQEMESLSVLAHRMKGTAGLYGYPQMSTLSGLLERLLDSKPRLEGEHQQQFLSLLHTINSVLRGGLNALRRGGSDRDLGLIFTQEGGTALLQRLVQEVPGEFQMRSARHLAQPQPDQEDQAAPAEAAPQGLEGELRQFVKDNAEVWEYFAPEVQEHLTNLRTELERGEEADLNVMFRAAHTIKGSSFMVGLQPLGDFAHRLEDLLGALREDAVPNNPEVQRTLHASVDLMDDLARVAEGAELSVQARRDDLLVRLRALATGQLAAAAPTPAPTPETAGLGAGAPINSSIRVPAQRLEALLEQVSEVVTARARMTRLLERLDDLQAGMQTSQQRFQRTVRDFEERYLNPDMVRVTDDPGASMGSGNLMEQFAELEFDSYNDLNILSRSITELSADFAEVRRNLSDTVASLGEENEKLGKLVRQLRVDVSQTSRVPFTQASTRLRRWARQQQLPFDLHVEGEDVQLESNLLQRIVDPLLHLLTNAVYHGLQGGQTDPEQRAAQGKPERGQVWLRAETKDSFIDVTVADDGQGLNLERIRERALERGLRSAQELDQMPASDVARLILLPGLSTAEQVGSVAGRGVGMDVVATAVRSLGGELLIQSERHIGTAFTLRLPITQRILDILKVDLGNATVAAFPVSSVRAIRDLAPQQISEHQGVLHAPFQDEQVPVIDARVLWGVDVAAADPGASLRLVFLSTVSGLVAVRVAEFGSIEEVSVTPPVGLLGKLDYLAGTTVSVTGEALPLLEPLGLLRLTRRPDLWLDSRARSESGLIRRVLLVDDSLSVRRLVGRMLERGGLQVETANDGQEALDKLQLDDTFDAVITDLEMPRMNGYELISALRARAQNTHTPILVMTTRAGDKHQRLAFQLGANDYFTKPVNEALLLRRLGTLLSAQPQGIPA